MLGNIRLGCMYCDRNDFDFVDELPTDWEDLHEVQSLDSAMRPVTDGEPGRSVFDWETHLGICPDCQSFYGDASGPPPKELGNGPRD